jgi:AMP-polyphosphate phosphotransferase
MFERYDLSQKLDNKAFSKAMPALQKRIGELQREYRDRGIPVIIVVEGWNASGIATVINELIRSLDPRGYEVSSIGRPNDEERARPMLWRFWIKTPAKGRIAIFARSWYSRSLAEDASGVLWENHLADSLTAIRHFEKQLAEDGTLILKFFLHISREEQKERLRERERSPLSS